jgi:hypothetical protein
VDQPEVTGYQMFRPNKYITMIERDILILEWLKEYEKQKLHMRDHIGIAIKKGIKTVASKLGLRVGGKLPTGMRDVISILKNKSNWEDASIATTRGFCTGYSTVNLWINKPTDRTKKESR